MVRFLLAAFIAVQAFPAGAACYTVYDAKNALVYRGNVTPVDLRYQLGETVPSQFGNGAVMIFSLDDDSCSRPEMQNGTVVNSATAGGLSTAAINVGSSTSSSIGGNAMTGYQSGGPALMSGASLGGGGGGSNGPIVTGPRGGQYYVNSNGNKTYVKR